MKRAFGSRRGYCALRFVAATPLLHRSRRLLLHIRVANASLNRPQFPAKPLQSPRFYAILIPERRCKHEKNIFIHIIIDSYAISHLLHGELVWRNGRRSVVLRCNSRSADSYLRLLHTDVENLHLPPLQSRIQSKALSALRNDTHGWKKACQMPELQ